MNQINDALALRAESQKWGTLAGAGLTRGGYYVCAQVGGWQDSKTGIRFPGPKANIDPDTREIVGLCDLPEPVQIPHYRFAEYSTLPEHEKRQAPRNDARARGDRELIKVAFDCPTLDEFTVGLLLAVRTGTIRHIDDFTMETTWPEVFAKQRAEIVFGSTVEQRVQRPEITSMLDDLMNSRRTSLAAEAAARKK